MLRDDATLFTELGFIIEYEDDLITGEFTQAKADDKSFLSPEDNAYYITVGKRFDRWLPLITYEHADADARTGISDSLSAGVTKGTVDAIIANRSRDRDILTLGARYNFHPSSAFKFELSQLSDSLDSGNDTSLLSVGVDIMF